MPWKIRSGHQLRTTYQLATATSAGTYDIASYVLAHGVGTELTPDLHPTDCFTDPGSTSSATGTWVAGGVTGTGLISSINIATGYAMQIMSNATVSNPHARSPAITVIPGRTYTYSGQALGITEQTFQARVYDVTNSQNLYNTGDIEADTGAWNTTWDQDVKIPYNCNSVYIMIYQICAAAATTRMRFNNVAFNLKAVDSKIYQNTATPPATSSFATSDFWADADGAGLGRFVDAPDGSVVYTNEKESCVWSGPESRIGAMYVCSATTLASPRDFTHEITNIKTSNATLSNLNVVPVTSTSPWLIFTTRPLKGMKYYLAQTINNSGTATAVTMTGKCWNGSAWATLPGWSDNTTASGRSLAQTGSVSWYNTSTWAEPGHFEGLYLYVYMFSLASGSADLKFASVDKPFQPIKDVWDGVYREPLLFSVVYDDTAEDYTLEVNEPSYVDTPIGAIIDGLRNITATANDYIVAQFEERMAGVHMQTLATLINTSTSSLQVSYWNGTAYATVQGLTDGSSYGNKTLSQTGLVSWQPPSATAEFQKTVQNSTGYTYKFELKTGSIKGAHSDGTTEALIDVVSGVPAQLDVPPFKACASYKNRVFLLGCNEYRKGNRADYSMSNSPDVWNGDETSMDGIQSLYFGGTEEITAGVELYNRFGASIFTTLVVFKKGESYLLNGDGPEDYKIYPISYNVGCPAPLTVVAAEMGFQMAKEVNRNIVMWLSYSGPYLFDGAVMHPMRGIDKYFDPNESVCINFDSIENARAWYDRTFEEYNLLIPSGSGQTTNNKWFVYSLLKKAWYEKVPTEYPQAAFPVYSDKGTRYIYGGLDSGSMIRMEHGPIWDRGFDTATSNAISQIWETGDFFPGESMWAITSMPRVKIVGKRGAETATLTLTHFPDSATATSDATVVLTKNTASGSYRITRDTEYNSCPPCWAHRIKSEVSTASQTKDFTPLSWGYEWTETRKDVC